MCKIILAICGIIAFLLFSHSCDDVNGANEIQPHGIFIISLGTPQEPDYTYVSGKIYDGPSPSATIWQEKSRSGDCRLYTPYIPFCSNPCGSESECVDDDVCQDYPKAVNVGTVELSGLKLPSGADVFSMSPEKSKVYQLPSEVLIPVPPCSEGDSIKLKAAGDDGIAAFSLFAECIAPLEVSTDSIVLSDGKDISLRWTAPKNFELTSISVTVDISYHGGSKGIVKCETSDDGMLEISASLLDTLKTLGVTGWPKLEVVRQSVHTKTSSETAIIVIESIHVEFLSIPGLHSCDEDEDCPDGQTCQPDFFMCK